LAHGITLKAKALCCFFKLLLTCDFLLVGNTVLTALVFLADFYSLRRDVEIASARVEDIRASSGLQQLEKELAALESKAADSSLWDDRNKAQEILSALTDVKDKIKMLSEFKTQVHKFSVIAVTFKTID
jgi:peptide chain release factor 2